MTDGGRPGLGARRRGRFDVGGRRDREARARRRRGAGPTLRGPHRPARDRRSGVGLGGRGLRGTARPRRRQRLVVAARRGRDGPGGSARTSCTTATRSGCAGSGSSTCWRARSSTALSRWSTRPPPARPATGLSSPLTRSTPTKTSPSGGRVLVVWGPAGAPGRTTVAVGLASEIAAAGHECLLLDVDAYGGAVAQHLGVLDEVSGLLAAARAANAGQLDEDRLERTRPQGRRPAARAHRACRDPTGGRRCGRPRSRSSSTVPLAPRRTPSSTSASASRASRRTRSARALRSAT